MRRAFTLGSALALAVLTLSPCLHAAQDDTLLSGFCPPDPPPDSCSDDNLGITFQMGDDPVDDALVAITGMNVFEYGTFAAGTEVKSVLTMATVSEMVQGWSLAVKHDESLLTITADGANLLPGVPNTDAQAAEGGFPFRKTSVVVGGYIAAEVLDIGGGGATLPPVAPGEVNTILRVTYTMDAEPPAEGTLLEYTSKELAVEGSPPVEVIVTNGGISLSPNVVRNARIVAEFGGVVCVPTPGQEDAETSCDDGLDNDCDGLIDDADTEDCGCTPTPGQEDAETSCEDGVDNDCDGLIDDADTEDCGCTPTPGQEDAETSCDDGLDNDCDGLIDDADTEDCGDGPCGVNTLYFGAAATDQNVDGGNGPDVPISSRNNASLLGFQLGVATTVDASSQSWAFSNDLGADADRLVELLFTDADGNSITPDAGNTASLTTADGVSTIARGAAIAAFAGNDFFAFDTNPGVGGTGFTVGYVSDLDGNDNQIPVTEGECPVNELLVVSVGGAGSPFNRGDADGNGKINTTDGVLIIQNVVGNLPKNYPNCDDILDANGDGTADLADATYLLEYIFIKTAPPPPAPFRTCQPASPTCGESNCQ